MFFRREKPRILTFGDRIRQAGQAGFETRQIEGGKVRVQRGLCAAVVQDVPGGLPRIDHAGIVTGNEIAVVTHGGYQMFLVTPGGKKFPATAPLLKTLHHFTESLCEALGLESYYNTSLGTVCEDHLYDRVEGRDQAPSRRPWEKLSA